MAFIVDISKKVTCVMHNDVCKEPMQLKCRHVVCKLTVDKLRGDQIDKITCPNCSKNTKTNDVKENFKLQRFAEFYRHEKKILQKTGAVDLCSLKKPPKSGQDVTFLFSVDDDVNGYIRLQTGEPYNVSTISTELQTHVGKLTYKLIELRKASRCYADFVRSLQKRKAAMFKAYNSTRHKLRVMRSQRPPGADKTEFNRLMLDLNETVEDEMDSLTRYYSEMRIYRERFSEEKRLVKDMLQGQRKEELLNAGLINYIVQRSEDVILTFLQKLKTIPEIEPTYRLEITSTRNDDQLNINQPSRMTIEVQSHPGVLVEVEETADDDGTAIMFSPNKMMSKRQKTHVKGSDFPRYHFRFSSKHKNRRWKSTL